MACARQSHLVVDSTKFGRLRPATFARLADFASVLTDDALPAHDRARLQAALGHRRGSGRERPRG